MRSAVRLALSNFLLGPELEQNLAAIRQLVTAAAEQRADLIVFPEAAPTGLNNNDDPGHDLPLGTTIPGPITERLERWAGGCGLWVVCGLLERVGQTLYDSAVVFDSAGELRLHYRRIQPQWHGAQADPTVYRQGTAVAACKSPWGRLSVLLCGDLFDDMVCEQTRAWRPDLLLVPLSRNFADGALDQARWDRMELPTYMERVRRVGCTAALVNELADRRTSDWPPFGGAWLADETGQLLAARPLGCEGLLVVEIGPWQGMGAKARVLETKGIEPSI